MGDGSATGHHSTQQAALAFAAASEDSVFLLSDGTAQPVTITQKSAAFIFGPSGTAVAYVSEAGVPDMGCGAVPATRGQLCSGCSHVTSCKLAIGQ